MDLSTFATTAGSVVPGPWGTGLKIAGALGGLFGGGGVDNSQYTDAMRNAGDNAGKLSAIRDWYSKNAAQQGANYNTDNGLARSAAGTLEKYYQTDPTNDSAYARDLARADGGLHANIARAQFDNLGNAGSNGSMVPGGGLSGAGHGINAYLSAMDALGTSANQVNVANSNQATRVNNMRDEYGLTSGMANQDYTDANQAQGAAGDLTKSLTDWYTGQANNALSQEQAAGGAEMGGLASLGSNIGGLLGQYTQKKKPTVQQGTPAYGGSSLPGVGITRQPFIGLG